MTTDLAVPDYAGALAQAADPAVYVLEACERAKAWLAHALEHGGIEQIIELKSQAEAIRVYTMSKQLGKDAQLSAAEIVRRAERGLGLAIRKGQESGEICKPKEHNRWANQHGGGDVLEEKKTSPREFFAGGQDQNETYAMTDGVSEEQFEAGLASARTEGNLSRRNVVRKVRAKRDADEVKASVMADDKPVLDIPDPKDRTGEASLRRRAVLCEMAAAGSTSGQISDRLGIRDDRVRQMAREMGVEIPADIAVGKGHRRIDSNRIVRETVHALDGLAMGVKLANLDDLDAAEIEHWSTSLTDSLRVLNRLNKQLKEKLQ